MKYFAQILNNFDEIPKTIEVITTDSPALATLSAILKLDLSKKIQVSPESKNPLGMQHKRDFRVKVSHVVNIKLSFTGLE